MNELDEFKKRVRVVRETRLKSIRDNYRYAKEQGFTTDEAVMLCQGSKARIDRLVELKEKE